MWMPQVEIEFKRACPSVFFSRLDTKKKKKLWKRGLILPRTGRGASVLPRAEHALLLSAKFATSPGLLDLLAILLRRLWSTGVLVCDSTLPVGLLCSCLSCVCSVSLSTSSQNDKSGKSTCRVNLDPPTSGLTRLVSVFSFSLALSSHDRSRSLLQTPIPRFLVGAAVISSGSEQPDGDLSVGQSLRPSCLLRRLSVLHPAVPAATAGRDAAVRASLSGTWVCTTAAAPAAAVSAGS